VFAFNANPGSANATQLKRVCTLVEHDLFMTTYSEPTSDLAMGQIQVQMSCDEVGKKPTMTFECADPLDKHQQLYFAGPVSTRASKQSLEIGMYGGHKLYISEADIDSEGWSPAWSIPVAGKKETPTVLMKHNDAELELPDELQLDAPTLKLKLPFLEIKEKGPLIRPKHANQPADALYSKEKIKIGPRAALNARMQELLVPQHGTADDPKDKKRANAQTYPTHLVHILS